MPILNEIDLLLLLWLRFLNSIGSFNFRLFWGRRCIDYLSYFAFLKLPSLSSFLNLFLRCFSKLLWYICWAMTLILLLWKAFLIFFIPFSFEIFFHFLFLSDVLGTLSHLCFFLLIYLLSVLLRGFSFWFNLIVLSGNLSGIVDLLFISYHWFVLCSFRLWLSFLDSFIHLGFWFEDILLLWKVGFDILV